MVPAPVISTITSSSFEVTVVPALKVAVPPLIVTPVRVYLGLE